MRLLSAAASFLAAAVAGCSDSPDRAASASFTVIPFESGWIQAGPGGYTVKDGVATPHGGMGLWWYGAKSYRNFILKIEFQQERITSNSGVYVRFPDPKGDPWHAVHNGYEIQIAGDQPSKNATGAVYDFQAATSVPLKPAGEWNEYEIACVGHRYTVRLNGVLVNDYVGSRNLSGHIGIQNHDDKSIVRYRNVRVRELGDGAGSQ